MKPRNLIVRGLIASPKRNAGRHKDKRQDIEDEVLTKETSDMKKCPNCSEPVIGHAENGCVLNTLVGIVRERGTRSDEEIEKLHAECDVDGLWNYMGEIVDKLEDGFFTAANDESR